MKNEGDLEVGDLVITRRSMFHPQMNGTLAEITQPCRKTGARDPNGNSIPVKYRYGIRLIENGKHCLALRDQLIPFLSFDEAKMNRASNTKDDTETISNDTLPSDIEVV